MRCVVLAVILVLAIIGLFCLLAAVTCDPAKCPPVTYSNLALIVNCHNPYGVPGERLIIADQTYVCTRIGTWAPL